MKREIKRKGFTLVELLIVIIVIGVLATMMMLSSSEAVSSAKVTTIINDLRAMKTAALSYYADHSASHTGAWTKEDLKLENLLPYLRKSKDETSGTQADASLKGYKVVVDNWEDWYVVGDLYEIVGTASENNTELKAICRKLSDRAAKAGVAFTNDGEKAAGNRPTTLAQDKTMRYVCMWIR